LAAVMKNREALAGKRVLIIVSGANIDFLQLGLIAQSEGSAQNASRSLRVRIPERPGTMLELLDTCFAGLNITDFQYGKTDEADAWPAFTVGSEEPAAIEALPSELEAAGFVWEDLTGAVDIAFRAIPLRGDLLSFPVFLRLDFYERPGALHDFLDTRVRGRANLCYFNYRQSGERIGRALIGLDFASEEERINFTGSIAEHGEGYRSCTVVDDAARARLIGN
jgi:threonine dehydratase